MEPWIEYDVPLEEKETSTADIILGVVPSTVDALQFINELEEKVPESMAKLLKSDAEQHYILMVCLKENGMMRMTSSGPTAFQRSTSET